MNDIPPVVITGSSVNRCVQGGKVGDFNWPFNVPDSAFGPWSPLCKSELLDPNFPCKPYVSGKPCNFKELAFLFTNVLHAVVTLCHDVPPAGDPGNPDWIDPRLLDIDAWLDFNWLGCYNSVSTDLQKGVEDYLFVILKETTIRQNYVYFTKYPELALTLESLFKTFNGCDWLDFDKNIRRVAGLILSYGKNKDSLTYQLQVQFINDLDFGWFDRNNDLLTRQKDYSLTKALEILAKKLTLSETLRLYALDDDVLRFELIKNECKGNYQYVLKYGTAKYNVRTRDDFHSVVKMVFGT